MARTALKGGRTPPITVADSPDQHNRISLTQGFLLICARAKKPARSKTPQLHALSRDHLRRLVSPHLG